MLTPCDEGAATCDYVKCLPALKAKTAEKDLGLHPDILGFRLNPSKKTFTTIVQNQSNKEWQTVSKQDGGLITDPDWGASKNS